MKSSSNLLKKLGNITLIFVVGFLGGILGTFLTLQTSHSSTSNTESKQVHSTTVKTAYKNTTSTSEAVDKVKNAVVSVITYSDSSNQGLFEKEENSDSQISSEGSGVIYKKEGKYAYLVTNTHVINGAKKVDILLADGNKVPGEVVGSDVYSDIAVVRISADKAKAVAEFGDSNQLTVGETAIAIGSPLGTDYANSVTQGIISSQGRNVNLKADNGQNISTRALQTDAAINPGNSGGPLINIQGQVIGITSSKISNNGQTSVEGMGFALPINDVITSVEQIIENGKVTRPQIGISGVSLSGYSSYQLRYYRINTDLTDGIYVSRVTSGGAASKAGIQEGDIIVKFDGKEVTTYKSFLTELYSKEPGDKVSVVVNRNGTEKTIEVTLGEQ